MKKKKKTKTENKNKIDNKTKNFNFKETKVEGKHEKACVQSCILLFPISCMDDMITVSRDIHGSNN